MAFKRKATTSAALLRTFQLSLFCLRATNLPSANTLGQCAYGTCCVKACACICIFCVSADSQDRQGAPKQAPSSLLLCRNYDDYSHQSCLDLLAQPIPLDVVLVMLSDCLHDAKQLDKPPCLCFAPAGDTSVANDWP